MKRYFIVLCLSLLLCGCSKTEDPLTAQHTKLVSYLTSTHSPKLIAEANVEPGTQQSFYTEAGDKVFRYIDNYYDPGRLTRAEVTPSSVVTITFRAYVFTFANIQDTLMPYFSNDPLLEEAFYKAGLTPGVWTFTPLEINMSNPDIIKGLEYSLLGCRQGDKVEIYMSYNMAYGDQKFSVIPRDSPIAWLFTVNSVR